VVKADASTQSPTSDTVRLPPTITISHAFPGDISDYNQTFVLNDNVVAFQKVKITLSSTNSDHRPTELTLVFPEFTHLRADINTI
jgi:hypothetical protein